MCGRALLPCLGDGWELCRSPARYSGNSSSLIGVIAVILVQPRFPSHHLLDKQFMYLVAVLDSPAIYFATAPALEGKGGHSRSRLRLSPGRTSQIQVRSISRRLQDFIVSGSSLNHIGVPPHLVLSSNNPLPTATIAIGGHPFPRASFPQQIPGHRIKRSSFLLSSLRLFPRLPFLLRTSIRKRPHPPLRSYRIPGKVIF